MVLGGMHDLLGHRYARTGHDGQDLGSSMGTKPGALPAPLAWLDSKPRRSSLLTERAVLLVEFLLFAATVALFIMLFRSFAVAACVAGLTNASPVDLEARASVGFQSTNVPQEFQTLPELFPGPTPTGIPAFLAQTNPAPFASTTYIPNTPLETQVPIVGNTDNGNIYQLHGQLSHYFPNPIGFGVEEYSLPEGAEIVQLNMLSRHGSRYPTTGSGATVLAQQILNATTGVAGVTQVNFTGELAFLNTWENRLGAEILTPVGHQELFDSGVLHQYMYGHLYPNNGTKVIARSTTEDRMTQSAEYFLSGFFGLQWPDNATLVLAIENTTGIWNNTLAGYDNCNNSNTGQSTGGTNATKEWYNIYLANATQRLANLSGGADGFNWTTTDSYNAQSLCAYETVALGYSAFCGLFTYEEWEGYEYSVDISFAGNDAFQSPTGRAVGIGYVQEILARLQHHTINSSVAQINVTLDSNPETFPIDQALNFDFSHDTNIMSILTAFGFTQFNEYLPPTEIIAHNLTVSHMEPFGARLDMEVINTPQPLNGSRAGGASYLDGAPTTYIHFILNQRTLPLGVSFPACGMRDDGWCELKTFMEVQASSLPEANYDYACFGDYPAYPYGTYLTSQVAKALANDSQGTITNGAPLTNETFTA